MKKWLFPSIVTMIVVVVLQLLNWVCSPELIVLKDVFSEMVNVLGMLI
ncbi:Uncharacterised protein [Mycobacteroides abscessus subsp. abscessus]|nr:Uncharacterised protein [Mycobacteroides abscessus subsp. abscessus]